MVLDPFYAFYEGLNYWKCQKKPSHATVSLNRVVLKIVSNSHNNNTAQIQTNLRPLLFLLSSGQRATCISKSLPGKTNWRKLLLIFRKFWQNAKGAKSYFRLYIRYIFTLYSMRKRVDVLSYMEKSFLFFPTLVLIPSKLYFIIKGV